MGAPRYVQFLFVSYTYGTTVLHYTYVWATFSAADVCYLYLENFWVTLLLWVRHLTCSLCWLPLPRESQS